MPPKLSLCLCNWRIYVDDIYVVYALTFKINLITRELNSKIKFRCEMESNNKLSFYMFATRTSNNKIGLFVYRETTNTNIYKNQYSRPPLNWKNGTLRSFIKRAKLIISPKLLLRNYIRNILTVQKDYLPQIVNDIIAEKCSQLAQGTVDFHLT